jgi:hypothetical protein
VKCLLSASAETWQAMWIRERVNDALNLDERTRPGVTEKKRDSVLMLGPFVDKVNSKRFRRFRGGFSGNLNGGAELR